MAENWKNAGEARQATEGCSQTRRRTREFVSGVVEGFYGKPWTWEQRRELMTRLAAVGLNSFVYAPKDDAKHRPSWRDAYTDGELGELRELVSAARQNKIAFYYSLAPGLDIVWSKPEELQCIMRGNSGRPLGCQVSQAG